MSTTPFLSITIAQHHALEAVAAGKVIRVYKENGNVFHGPQGVGARALWALDRLGLIEDERKADAASKYSTKFRQVLTTAGRSVAQPST